jgi:hypothetical protein
MVGGLYMLGHVFVFGCVTTADITTNQAHAQARPGIAKIDTIPANLDRRLPDLNKMQVRTSFLFQLVGESQPQNYFWNTKMRRCFGHIYFLLMLSCL